MFESNYVTVLWLLSAADAPPPYVPRERFKNTVTALSSTYFSVKNPSGEYLCSFTLGTHTLSIGFSPSLLS